jgi:MarR family transcriptional regulator, organic hydroperoxide resistance regulator
MPELQQGNPLELERQLCFVLAASSRSVVALYRPHLQKLGLTQPQYHVMIALWQKSPRSVRELGETLLLDPATLSPLLKRLEAAGLVTRSRNHDDERALDIGLTEAGEAMRIPASEIPGRVLSEVDLPISELASIRDSITTLLGAIR